MAFNNTVTLIGNLGQEAKIIEQEGSKTFATFSIATADSYQLENGEWETKDTIWHRLISFSPVTIEKLRRLKAGTRVEIIGSLSYRPFETILLDGRAITKLEATVIASKLELKPLVKKQAV